MNPFLLHRFLWMIPVLFAISLITFTLMHLTPGGPWDGDDVQRKNFPPAVVANLNHKFNLDLPLWEQYVRYIADTLRGDLGPSYQYIDQSVSDLLFAPPTNRPIWESRFLRSALLGLLALGIAICVGIPLGVIAALKHNTWLDYGLLLLATFGTALPSFVMAVFALFVFGLWLRWLPIITNWNDPKSWALPALVLSFGLMAFLARLTRAMMLETLGQDYLRTARAKGLHERTIVIRHALRNSLIPVATVLGPAFAGLITGSFFIETMFSFPGMGRFFVQSVNARDYSMIMGTTLLYAVLISLSNLSVDIIYGRLDPRIGAE
jgi:oligopeptide transport system permease protein